MSLSAAVSKPPGSRSNSAWQRRLEASRDYLLGVAARQIRPQWRAKLAASDLVQQTLFEAARCEPCVGETEEDLRRWLRRILANNVRDASRKLTTEKRAVGREVGAARSSLMKRLATSSRLEPPAVAVAREERAALDAALNKLPWNYQYIVHLRHAQQLRFSEIGELLGVSENAAQKLWTRAIDALEALVKNGQ